MYLNEIWMEFIKFSVDVVWILDLQFEWNVCWFSEDRVGIVDGICEIL